MPKPALLSAESWKSKKKENSLSGEGLIKAFIADEIKAVEGDEESLPKFRFVISSETRDRDGDTLSAKGWDLEHYRKNPVILYGHDNRGLPIGQALSVDVKGKKLVAEAQFDTDIPEHPLPRTVVALLKRGTLRATSVGFIPVEWKDAEVDDPSIARLQPLDFLRQVLVEFSIVPVPSNPDALLQARAAGVDISPVVNWAGEILDMYGGAAVKGLWVPRKTLEQVAKFGKMAKIIIAPKGGWKIELEEKDPIRWNKSLSKSFDIDRERFEPASAELGLVSRYLDVEIKHIHQGSLRIPAYRMGSFLTALEEATKELKLDDTRNLESNRELPPVFEIIELNSTDKTTFLIEGTRFWDGAESSLGFKIVVGLHPVYWGLHLTYYSTDDDAALMNEFMGKVWGRAMELKFLKGEAFALSGEFIPKGDETFDDLFLAEKNQKAIQRVVDLVNRKQDSLESRGMILMGPPGTGKTLSARIMRNISKATFIWVSARDMFYCGSFGGFSEAFELAKENAPTVLVFEDVDNWLYRSTIDYIKTEMDGVQKSKGVVTVLTTNFPELLPEALIDRPGRFHDVLSFDVPDETVRATMVRKWLPDLSDTDVLKAVQATDGYSGAHIRELARFVEILKEEDESMDLPKALDAAIEKLEEQRDLITQVQTEGSRYRPSRSIEMAVQKNLPAMKLKDDAKSPPEEDEGGEKEESEEAPATETTLLTEEEKQEGFKVQTLIFPKSMWKSADSAKSWAKNHGFKSDKVDETENSYRLRQQDPGRFARLRTICINPSRDTSMDECRVKAVGGPMKEAEAEEEKEIHQQPSDVLSAYERMKNIERVPVEVSFRLSDGFPEEMFQNRYEKVVEEDEWVILIREGSSSYVWPLHCRTRSEAIQFALETAEKKKDPSIVVILAQKMDHDEQGRPVYTEQAGFKWKEEKKEADENDSPISMDGVGVMDVIEAVNKALGPALKKALADVTGRVDED